MVQKLTEESMEFIISILIECKIEAETNNVKGINDGYIEAANKALHELKQLMHQ